MNETLQGVLLGGAIGFISIIITATINHFSEIRKKKSDKHLTKLEECFTELETFSDKLFKGDTTTAEEKYKDFFPTLLYATNPIIRLATEFNSLLSTNNEDKDKTIKFTENIELPEKTINTICCFALLMCQIKYDVTGVVTNPVYWLKIKLPAYGVI